MDSFNRPSSLLLLLAIPAFAAAQAGSQIAEPKELAQSYEAEFVASNVFRTGSLRVPFAKRLSFEGYYFGGTATETDVGYTGVGVAFVWRELKLIPGFGAVFGSNRFTASPAVSLRWKYEKKWFESEGLVVQSFRSTPIFEEEENGHEKLVADVRPTISDGNHLSAVWKRITIGGTWEHIAFREGSEWKGGGRLAVKLHPRISAILYVLTPGVTEWRGGILIHPR